MIRTRRAALAQSAQRFSGKIMLKQQAKVRSAHFGARICERWLTGT
jgi:hypothetical protein